jgi:A/G-specific adenine glycosylase
LGGAQCITSSIEAIFSHIAGIVMTRLREKEFAQTILQWFDENRRALPWRETRDPYFIWLSEIILQQTRVAQGISYYENLTRAFPTVTRLARAKEERVLRLWQGLGYYSRARNLHRCARIVTDQLDGKFPRTHQELIQLPGIGPYTAAAVASIAFDDQVAAVDGNVLRVLSRIFGIDTDVNSPAGRKFFREKAQALIPNSRPGDFNQAMMEFGAIKCTPINPECASCPFRRICVAYASGSVHMLPVKIKKMTVRRRFLNYVIFSLDDKVGMRARNGSDIWKGLYDFYLVESNRPLTAAALMRHDKNLRNLATGEMTPAGEMRHQLTHQLLHIAFFTATTSKKNLTKFDKGNPPVAFYSMKQAARLPKPVPVKLFLENAEMVGGRK